MLARKHSLLGEPNKSNIKVMIPEKQCPRLTFVVHITAPHMCVPVYTHTYAHTSTHAFIHTYTEMLWDNVLVSCKDFSLVLA